MIERTSKLLSKLFIIAFIAFIIWGIGLLSYIHSIPKHPSINTKPTDAIIVLTGGGKRLTEALALLNKDQDKELFISGVGKQTNLHSLLILSGKLPNNISELTKRISLGYEAKDTAGNAQESIAWLKKHGYQSARLVTTHYHMPRSLLSFQQYDPSIEIIPYPVFPERFSLKKWWLNPQLSLILFKEYNKLWITKLRYNLG